METTELSELKQTCISCLTAAPKSVVRKHMGAYGWMRSGEQREIWAIHFIIVSLFDNHKSCSVVGPVQKRKSDGLLILFMMEGKQSIIPLTSFIFNRLICQLVIIRCVSRSNLIYQWIRIYVNGKTGTTQFIQFSQIRSIAENALRLSVAKHRIEE